MKAPAGRLVSPAAFLVLALGAAPPAPAQATRSMFDVTPPVALGQPAAAPATREPSWGTTMETSYYVGAPAFSGAVPNVFVVDDGIGSAYFSGTGTAYAWAPINLPQGAAITGYDLYYYDANASQDLSAILYEVDSSGSFSAIGAGFIASSGSSGWGSVSSNLTTPRTVNNNVNSYWAWVTTGNTPVTDLRWRGVRVRYKLQVSPSPGVATFTDVPLGHPFNRFVEALVAAGITAGCGGGNYCPDSPLTRGQMAVFLATALGLNWP